MSESTCNSCSCPSSSNWKDSLHTERENDWLNSQLKSMEKRLTDAEEENSVLIQDYQQTTEDRKLALIRVNDLQTEVEELQHLIKEYNTEKQTLINNIRDTEQELIEYKSESLKSQQVTDDIRTHLEKANEVIQTRTLELEELENKLLNQIDEERLNCSNHEQKLQSELDELKSDKVYLNMRINQLETSILEQSNVAQSSLIVSPNNAELYEIEKMINNEREGDKSTQNDKRRELDKSAEVESRDDVISDLQHRLEMLQIDSELRETKLYEEVKTLQSELNKDKTDQSVSAEIEVTHSSVQCVNESSNIGCMTDLDVFSPPTEHQKIQTDVHSVHADRGGTTTVDDLHPIAGILFTNIKLKSYQPILDENCNTIETQTEEEICLPVTVHRSLSKTVLLINKCLDVATDALNTLEQKPDIDPTARSRSCTDLPSHITGISSGLLSVQRTRSSTENTTQCKTGVNRAVLFDEFKEKTTLDKMAAGDQTTDKSHHNNTNTSQRYKTAVSLFYNTKHFLFSFGQTVLSTLVAIIIFIILLGWYIRLEARFNRWSYSSSVKSYHTYTLPPH